MKTRTLLAVASVALLALAAFPVLGQDAEGEAAAPTLGLGEQFNGTWRYAGSASHGTNIIHRAVDHCVEPENFVVRSVAAGRLRDKNQLVRSVVFTVGNGNARIVYDGNRTYRTVLGSWRRHSFGGDSVNVQIRATPTSIVQLFRTDGGTRRNVYRMTGEGRMRLEVTVQANSLERDMSYRLNYRR